MGLVIMAVVMFVIAGVLALIGKNKVAATQGPQATIKQAEESVDAVKVAIERGQAQAEAEAEARAARKAAPSITAGSTPTHVPAAAFTPNAQPSGTPWLSRPRCRRAGGTASTIRSRAGTARSSRSVIGTASGAPLTRTVDRWVPTQ